MRIAPQIELSDDERKTLMKWSRGRSTPARVVQRANIVLLAADGLESKVTSVRTSFSELCARTSFSSKENVVLF